VLYGAALSAYASDQSAQAKAAGNFAMARRLEAQPSEVWLELTELYRVDDKPAGWALLALPQQPAEQQKLADILAKDTGWTAESASAAADRASRAGYLGLSISVLEKPAAWKARTCRQILSALEKISAAKREYIEWIVRNIGSSTRTQELVLAADELDHEIAALKKWAAIFGQQEADNRKMN
jgi:hypothetical protein